MVSSGYASSHRTTDTFFARRSRLKTGSRGSVCSLRSLYAAFGFSSFSVALSTRPAQRVGSDDLWDRAELVLATAARGAELVPELQAGEGAFYGPKLEFSLRDRLGRSWQCGTIQLDFVMPERFGLSYVDSRGGKARPVMLHRAIFGSIERFVAILLEHHQRALPGWLAPEQVRVLPSLTNRRPMRG